MAAKVKAATTNLSVNNHGYTESVDNLFFLTQNEILSHEIVCPRLHFSERGASATGTDI
jgi:hypothetical protein